MLKMPLILVITLLMISISGCKSVPPVGPVDWPDFTTEAPARPELRNLPPLAVRPGVEEGDVEVSKKELVEVLNTHNWNTNALTGYAGRQEVFIDSLFEFIDILKATPVVPAVPEE